MTSPTSSGKAASAQEVGRRIEEELNKVERRVGLPPFNDCGAGQYIGMGPDQLRKLTPDELNEAAYLLSSYAFHLLSAYNRAHSKASRLEIYLKQLIAREVDKHTGYGYEERRTKAINANEHASAVLREIGVCRMEADRLHELSKTANRVSGELARIAEGRAKRYGR